MSIDAILRSAITGLNTSQATLRTTADNIANVNTPSYARKVTHLETNVVGGETVGVQLASIQRVVDQFLIRELRSASSESKRYEAMTQIHDRIGMLLGDPSANTSLTGRLDDMFAGLTDLAIEPDSTVRRTAAIADITNFASEASRLSEQLQLLRAEADDQIATDITAVNDNLERIHELNKQIAYQTLQGNTSTGLIDQRDKALGEIAEVIDIRTSDLGNGKIGITTSDGVVLLDANRRKLVYNQPGTVTSSTSFPQITANLVNSTTGAVSSTGTALDPRVQAGSLRGWLDMRDQVVPDMALQLGEFAGQVMDQLNAVHNDNSAVPALNSMTGRNTGLTGTDLIGFTGEVTFALVDSTQAITTTVDVNFDAATYSVNGGAAVAFSGTTVADLITDVNTGFGGGATLALSSGALTFAAAAGTDGVVVQQDTVNPSLRGGRGFSHFFGLNDLIGATAQSHYDTGLTTTSAHGFGATGIASFELRGPNNEIATTFTLDFSAVGGTAMSNVLSDLNTAASGFVVFTLDSNGALVATPANAYSDYKLNVTNDTTNRSGTGVTFGQFFGVGDRYRTNAALDMAVRSDILADPIKLALADLDTAAASGKPALSVADGRGAVSFQDIIDANVSFAKTVELAAASTTLGNYAASILENAAINADQADKLQNDRSSLHQELQVRNDEISGVNLDEELSNMIVYQNAYNAAARMISTSREMFDILQQLVG